MASTISAASVLNDEGAGDNQAQACPCSGRHVLAQDKAAGKHTDCGEDGDVYAQQFGEVPLDEIDDKAIASKRQATGAYPQPTAVFKALTHNPIAADLQDGGRDKDEPGNERQAEVFHDALSANLALRAWSRTARSFSFHMRAYTQLLSSMQIH